MLAVVLSALHYPARSECTSRFCSRFCPSPPRRHLALSAACTSISSSRLAEAPDLRAADCAVRTGRCRHAVVGRGLGRADLCDRPDRETADAAAAVLSFRAFNARHVGIHRLSSFVHAADGNVLDRGARSEHHAEEGRCPTRHFRQELYRPEPGIRFVRRGARLSGHHFPAGETNLAGGIADRGVLELRRQHGACYRVADGAGHHADHAGRVRSAAPEMAE